MIGSILSLLGFSGCNAIQNIIDMPAEYGMPHANYKLLGDVQDTKGQPVKGIRVIFAPNGNPEQEKWDNDTLYTDDKGHFRLDRARYQFGWVDEDKITFIADDVDGKENGSFKSAKVKGKDKITVTKVKDGDHNWYSGEFEIGTHITMEEKSE